MSAKTLLSGPDALLAQEKRKSTEQDDQTVVRPQAKLDSTHCEPREKVLNTTEILEGILECLPAKTLFVVQRVNKRFHHTIADSPRIQWKMFLRIDNDHSVVWYSQYIGMNNWRFKQVPAGAERSRGVVTPVVHNPCLELVRGPENRYLKTLGEGVEDLRISCRQTYSFQHFEHQSIGKGFFSDPQCTIVQTRLSFNLGSIIVITVRAIIKSDTPLTIAEVVSRTLGSDGKLSVLWLHQFPSTSGENFREGLPRKLIKELKDQTGLEVVSAQQYLCSASGVSWYPRMRRYLPPLPMGSRDKRA